MTEKPKKYLSALIHWLTEEGKDKNIAGRKPEDYDCWQSEDGTWNVALLRDDPVQPGQHPWHRSDAGGIKSALTNYMAQAANAEGQRSSIHEKLLASGYTWDGMDGYTKKGGE
jgi:hypothetical protein